MIQSISCLLASSLLFGLSLLSGVPSPAPRSYMMLAMPEGASGAHALDTSGQQARERADRLWFSSRSIAVCFGWYAVCCCCGGVRRLAVSNRSNARPHSSNDGRSRTTALQQHAFCVHNFLTQTHTPHTPRSRDTTTQEQGPARCDCGLRPPAPCCKKASLASIEAGERFCLGKRVYCRTRASARPQTRLPARSVIQSIDRPTHLQARRIGGPSESQRQRRDERQRLREGKQARLPPRAPPSPASASPPPTPVVSGGGWRIAVRAWCMSRRE